MLSILEHAIRPAVTVPTGRTLPNDDDDDDDNSSSYNDDYDDDDDYEDEDDDGDDEDKQGPWQQPSPVQMDTYNFGNTLTYTYPDTYIKKVQTCRG